MRFSTPTALTRSFPEEFYEMPTLTTDELVRDLRARRIMVDGGNGNVYDVADESCEQAADHIVDLERKIALVMQHDSNLIDGLERLEALADKHGLRQ